ncbi:MAG: hypothetical protein KKC76_06260 [Proteobacteria bacterium]|nr:hypothetical protein [Pseudomonadota bacterium]MBU4297624.1 hypothetical protein [Pseudomonadota bacterium]MCG2750013.1 hypothetical protein [Desulfobulbaceae bacterium]
MPRLKVAGDFKGAGLNPAPWLPYGLPGKTPVTEILHALSPRSSGDTRWTEVLYRAAASLDDGQTPPVFFATL